MQIADVRLQMADNGKKKEALKEFQSIAQMDPKEIWPLGYMATIYGDLGQVDPAIAILQKALSMDSNVAIFHFLLGQAYSRKGDSWRSTGEMGEALRLKALGN